MRQTHLFTKTRKEAPKDEVSRNAELLIRAGYIYKEMAGVYTYLPLGLRVLTKIQGIIREEVNALGGQEMLLTSLQDKKLWEKTGRWSDDVVDNWFKSKLANGSDVGLASTHEEPLTHLLSEYVNSYRDLPFSAYQFQTKFRNEARAKSGIMRGREFLMKDLYSFAKDQTEHEAYYEKAKIAYKNIYSRVGLGDRTFMTFALGGSFSKYSHEFQTITDAGEDLIYIDLKKGIAINKEALEESVLAELGVKREELVEKKAVEVGNIFSLGTRFSEPLGLTYKDETGAAKPVIMGCYGIGLGRLMGTIVEALSDEKGIVWPVSVAPFAAHLIVLDSKAGEKDAKGENPAREHADDLYEALTKAGIETLYDDRASRPGEKFADADLIGIPVRIVISDKTLAAGKYEVTDRKTGTVEHLAEKELLAKLKA